MKIEIDGLNINYEIYGQGEPLLILHGWGGCIDSMTPITNFLKDKYKVIVIDFLGHGKSDYPKTAIGVLEYALITKKFLDRLKIDKLYLIGHSFGGRIGIILSSKYPNLIEKMILVDSGGIKPKKKLKNQVKIYTYKFIKQFLKIVLFNSKTYEKIMIKLRTKAGSKDYKDLPESMKATFIKIVNEDLQKYLKNIKTPTLIVWGENDKDTPIYMAEKIKQGISDSGIVLLKDAGHFSYLDKSYEFNIIANNFLSSEGK